MSRRRFVTRNGLNESNWRNVWSPFRVDLVDETARCMAELQSVRRAGVGPMSSEDMSERPLALAASSSESYVALAGDWHGNVDWIGRAIPAIAREAPGVRTILHAGDFGIWADVSGRKYIDAVDFWCDRAGISRVLVTPGTTRIGTG